MGTLGPYELNSIVTGDARELAREIPDESVDLIFCDPVYQNIDDYRWLAETAKRILRPDGNLLAFTNAKWLSRLLREVPTDLPPISYQRASAMCPMNGRVIAKTHYAVWWGSGHLWGYMPDGYLSENWSKNYQDPGGHRWTKNPKFIRLVLRNFTLAGMLVLDFFCGHGTIPATCKEMGRNYWACEIDPTTADNARLRVQNTQPPLFVLQPEQAEMFSGAK